MFGFLSELLVAQSLLSDLYASMDPFLFAGFGGRSGGGSIPLKEEDITPKFAPLEVSSGFRKPQIPNIIYPLAVVDHMKDAWLLTYSDCSEFFNTVHKPIIKDFTEYADFVINYYNWENEESDNPGPPVEELVSTGGHLRKQGVNFVSYKDVLVFKWNTIGNITESLRDKINEAIQIQAGSYYHQDVFKKMKKIEIPIEADIPFMAAITNNIMNAVCANYIMLLRWNLGLNYNSIKDRAAGLGYEYSAILGILDFNHFMHNFFEKLWTLVKLRHLLCSIIGKPLERLDAMLYEFKGDLEKYDIYWDMTTGYSTVHWGIINLWNIKFGTDSIRRNIYLALLATRNTLLTNYRIRVRIVKYLYTYGLTLNLAHYIKTPDKEKEYPLTPDMFKLIDDMPPEKKKYFKDIISKPVFGPEPPPP